MKVCISAATYRRPRGLQRLLQGLNALTFETTPPPEVHVVIVDNDPTGSARRVCATQRPIFRWPLHYVVEPRRGLPQARNRAVSEARALGTDFIAFIDDDEVPEPCWLDALLLVQGKHKADIVTGPVLPHFAHGNEHWLVQAGFFAPWMQRYPTGEPRQTAGTGNLLLRLEALPDLVQPFDERLALIGGEDTMLTQQLHERGASIIWADEAVVHERMPASRMRATWIMQRSFRLSNAACHRDFLQNPGVKPRLIRLLKGVGRLTQGILMIPLGLFQGRVELLRAGVKLALGVGSLAAVFNYRYEEYRTVHGD